MDSFAYNFIREHALTAVITLTLLVFPTGLAQAQTLGVNFETEPLFDASSFLPGDTITKTVEVSNGSEALQTVQIEAVDVIDSEGLGKKLDINISESNTQLYTESLHDFLRAGELTLSDLDSGANTTYTLTVTFENTEDNSTQGKSLGFDLCVGFAGGELSCGDTATSDEGSTINNSGGGGSGGSSGQSLQLDIYNERVTQINDQDESAQIEWNTNRVATSRVIYGAADQEYTLDIDNPPGYGYPNYTSEFTPKTKEHAVDISGLTPGETYVYRVVSRASPPTVSKEHQFKVASDSGLGGANAVITQEQNTQSTTEIPVKDQVETVAEESDNKGVVAGTSTDTSNTSTTKNNKSRAGMVANIFASIPQDISDICLDYTLALIVAALLIAYLITRVFNRISFLRTFSVLIGIEIIILLFAGVLCSLLPVLIIFVFSLILRLLSSDTEK